MKKTYNLHLTDILAVGHQRQATVLDAEGDAEDEGLPVAEFDPEGLLPVEAHHLQTVEAVVEEPPPHAFLPQG